MTRKRPANEFKGWPIVFWIVFACDIALLWHGRVVHRVPTEYTTHVQYAPYVERPTQRIAPHKAHALPVRTVSSRNSKAIKSAGYD